MAPERPCQPARFRLVIRVYDLDRSVEFYEEGLGLRLIERWSRPDGSGALLDAGGGLLELVGKPASIKIRGGWDFVPPVAKFDLILEVPDLDAWHASLRARGLEPLSAPNDLPGGGRSFTIQDPDETPVVFREVTRG